jgi:prophage maintenance system killer protein
VLTFGASTLGQRRHEQQVSFGIVLGTRANPKQRVVNGLGARSLPHRLNTMCSQLSNAFEESDQAVRRNEYSTVLDAVLPAAKAYCQFLAWHPYFDGNGRTAFPILTFALIRMGLIAVAVPESQEFHWCLGQGMRRNKRDFGPFARHVEDIIKRSAPS